MKKHESVSMKQELASKKHKLKLKYEHEMGKLKFTQHADQDSEDDFCTRF